jgi:uncharacterized OB-fold protein
MSADTPPKFTPDPDGLNADFYRCAATGRLHLQRCDACARTLHPPRYLCAGCGSDQLTFVAAEGPGKLFSWTITHRPVDPGWAADGPWATVVVEMQEGVRVVGGWRGTLDELRLDLPVDSEVEVVSEDFARIYFKPSHSAGE